MKLICKCKGCNKKYIIGENAIVTSVAGALESAHSKYGVRTTIIGDGSSLEGNKSDPDLVMLLTRSLGISG